MGSALVRALRERNDRNERHDYQLILRSHDELDLLDADHVADFFSSEAITTVYLAAARVGGIQANNLQPAQFIRENLLIEANVIHQAWRHRVNKLLFLGSSCIYPRLAPQPIPESALLDGPLEQTNEPYAIAKIAGVKLCESYNRQYGTDFRSLMPTNLYGPGDNFDLESSHVLPALLRKIHDAHHTNADEVVIWGSGTPMREFLHVDDLASACLRIMQIDRDQLSALTTPQCSHINVGSGEEISIADLAQLIANIIGYEGRLFFDRSKPDGTPRKFLDSGKINALGWKPNISLREGILRTYR
ncbi:MAG: GDP-L-fucose synthase, partial [Oxalobacteraceae bacterium]|nr:GDP-L-fucose synthase [Oxalobacteraceae bacterium]